MLPVKTIERLITYRSLLDAQEQGGQNVFSHQIADLAGVSAAQVRRDLMAVGYSGSPKNGYHTRELAASIRQFLAAPEGNRMVLVGLGNLGKAILTYFSTQVPGFAVVAAFDTDPHKAGRVICGCRCLAPADLPAVVRAERVGVGVLTVPAAEAQKTADLLVAAGVRALVNFAHVRLRTPPGVFVEHMDMALAFEKVACLARAGGADKTGTKG